MSQHYRLPSIAKDVAAAGLRGEDMTAVLAKMARKHDLNPDEIRRVGERANREAHLAFHEQAKSKKFAFALAHPEKVIGELKQEIRPAPRKRASVEKTAGAQGVDGFDAPYRPQLLAAVLPRDTDPRLVEHEALSQEYTKDAALHRELLTAKTDLEALLHECRLEKSAAMRVHHARIEDSVAQAAALIDTGVTLQNLYHAMVIGVAGSQAATSDRKYVMDFLPKLVTELRQRGVTPARMGAPGPAWMSRKMTDEELCAWARGNEQDLPAGTVHMEDTKIAMMIATIGSQSVHALPGKGPLARVEEAVDWLNTRPSNPELSGPLSDEHRVVDAKNEFIVAATDLVGAQNRITKLHASEEYIGIKLKQINENLERMVGLLGRESSRLSDLDGELRRRSVPVDRFTAAQKSIPDAWTQV